MIKKIVFISLFVAVNVCLAEGDPFFNKGYATGTDIFSDEQNKDDKTGTPTAEKKQSNADFGIKVRSIGAVIFAEDREHAVSELAKLDKFIVQTKLKLGKVYLITSPENLLDLSQDIFAKELSFDMYNRIGSVLEPVVKAPAQYSIERSPTWIVKTEEGQILLEGVSELSKYVNKDGYFIEKGFQP